jgi:hypothetical protein
MHIVAQASKDSRNPRHPGLMIPTGSTIFLLSPFRRVELLSAGAVTRSNYRLRQQLMRSRRMTR